MKDTSEQRYEANNNSLYPTHESTTESAQPQSPTTASPRSPAPSRRSLPRASSFPQPWDSSGAAEYEQQLNKRPSQKDVAEDAELAGLEAEVARVKQRGDRVEELHALEAREEELRKSIQERKTRGSLKP
jgi:hypothetical protein